MTIVLRSLVVRSGATTLVDGVDLHLAPGSRTALVGASGAGKSLTCAALAGTLPAGLEVSGSLTVAPDGADPDHDSRASSDPADQASGVNLLGLPAAMRPRSCRIALVSQDHSTALHPLVPVVKQVALAARAARRGADRRQATSRALTLLDAVGVAEHEAAVALVDHAREELGERRRRVSGADVADLPDGVQLHVVERAQVKHGRSPH